jgi:transposase InsO family protein
VNYNAQPGSAANSGKESSAYVASAFDQELLQSAIKHTRTKPFHPWTNGKVERYNRTLLNEWAYARPYRSERARTRALDGWLHAYNHHRHHTAIGGPPVSRVNNLVGQHT